LDKQSVYKINIIKELFFAKELSSADICLLTNKSLPLTTRLLTELLEEGCIVENGYALSTGGRRPQMFSLRAGFMYIVSVAMDQYVTRMSIIDTQGNVVGAVESVELKLVSESDTLQKLGKYIGAFIEESGINREKIAGIGIGMPGFIDVNKGVNHSYLKNSHGSVVGYLELTLQLPVFIDNDSSLIALAEFRFGAARHRKNVMVVNIGWGVGLGIIANGKIFRGQDGFAGEFSHIPLFSNDKLCVCGKTGCLETEASLAVVIDKAVNGLAQGRPSLLSNSHFPSGHCERDYEDIFQAALKGDRFAVELFSEAGYKIGRGVAVLIHLFNPELVVLSGRGGMAGNLLVAPLQQALNEHCIPRLAANTKIGVSTLGHQAELIGAAALVMENKMHRKNGLQVKSKPEKFISTINN
jgi:predicted NBD/HSP70 family sugar kinase